MAARKPWHKQRGETNKSFVAFCGYRDLGPNRSLVRLSRNRGARSSVTWLSEWSRKHGWVARAEAWDEEQDRIRCEAGHDEARAQGRRFAEMADCMAAVCMRTLERYAQENLDDLSPRDLARLADVAVKVGSLSRGQPTVRMENVTPDVHIGELARRVTEQMESGLGGLPAPRNGEKV